MKDGKLETFEGRPALRFERYYAHPVDRVWQAVSVPEQLEHWFPRSAMAAGRGRKIDAHGMHGKCL